MPDDQDNKQAGTLDEALTRLVNAYVRGEQPDLDEFVAQYPQHEAQIRQRVVSLREVDALFDSLAQADASDFEEAAPERDLAGQRVGNSEVVERIGRGGMGVVYLAHDTKLKRSVALKSMPARLAGDATARMRFRREAELLASLNHPNIAVIHDIIEEEPGYFVLEYVPGETLAERSARGPLAPERVLSIGRQIAEAIAAAHEKGVIHRDLKPGNIKLTPAGRVKVLDFGLAKLIGPEGESQDTTVTQGGRIAGTPAYMSPEQARGKPVDHRTDIWSFGCILYQMLTGRLPFEGETATDILAHIIEREPDWRALPSHTPTNLRVLLRRCLEKDPEKRLGDIAEAAVGMSEASTPGATRPVAARAKARRIALAIGAVTLVALGIVAVRFAPQGPARSSTEEIRLVVLPFKNLGPAEEQWRADGITDEISTRLGPIRNLAIIGSYSASQYKDKGTNPRQIGKELDVDYILEGSVQSERSTEANPLVRMRVRLVRASDATQIWAESYDGDMSNVLRRQTDIAEKVAQALDLTLLEPERKRLTYGYIDNAEAFACFRQGHEYRLLDKEGNVQAIEMFEKAIALEPNYAEAHASLSNALTGMYWIHDFNREHLPRAKEEADRAIQLAPDLPAGHVVLARYYYQGCYDYENALKQYSIVLRSHPNHVLALAWTGFVQRRMGRFEEALPNLLRAAELDPLDQQCPDMIGNTYVFLGRYEKAERYYDQVIRMDPNAVWGYNHKVWLYLIWQGDTTEARKAVDEALRNNKKIEPRIFKALLTIDIYDRKFEAAVDRLVQRSEDFDSMAEYIPTDLWLAEVYGYMEKEDLERTHYQLAADILEKKFAEDPDHPGIHRVHSSLGKAYAGLGREEEAIYEGLRGVECLPITKDAERGPMRLEDLARIYVMVGKYEDAIDILEQILTMPSEQSVARLRLDLVWDPLRDHSRFTRLLAPGP